MKTYQVLQGVMSNTGNGDLEVDKEFTTKAEAVKYFNQIKNDTKGWCIPKNHCLQTMIVLKDDESDEFPEIIDLHEAK